METDGIVVSTRIKPTVGRVVWYHPDPCSATSGFSRPQNGVPCAALIAGVFPHDEAFVSLAVFDASGTPHSRPEVPLIQGCDAVPDTGHWCEWMPYQKGQAAKTEALEQRLAEGARAGLPTRNVGLNFGQALEFLKAGHNVARRGWNGKGMYIFLNEGSTDFGEGARPMAIDGVSTTLFRNGHKGTSTRLPNINMHTASGSTVMGWLASQTDMLAEDWEIAHP